MQRQGLPVVVVGAGGAGLIAAWRAASAGVRVVLCERNRKCGIKLLISGGGRCNVTHAGPIDEMLRAFRTREARFLRPSLHRFSNDALLQMLNSNGVPSSVRPNGRVFPASGNAHDVVALLERRARDAGAEIRLNCPVDSVMAGANGRLAVTTPLETVETSHVVLATGGVSYPRTGTTGDGYRWVASMGHTIVPLRPALAPIGVEPPLPPDWRGVALRDGCLRAVADGRVVGRWNGDILFSHEGITGPAALEVSFPAALAREHGAVHLEYDFAPSDDLGAIDRQLTAMMTGQRARMIGTLVQQWIPQRIIPHLLRSVGVDHETRGHLLTREERRAVAGLLKGWRIGEVGVINIDRGEVTAGGIDLDEVDPKSMRSRIVNGLYLCGEILDIAGPVGGYNLQAAFSTGYVAGETAALDWHRDEIPGGMSAGNTRIQPHHPS